MVMLDAGLYVSVTVHGEEWSVKEREREGGRGRDGNMQQFHFHMQISVFVLFLLLLFALSLFNGFDLLFSAFTMQM